MLTRDQDLFFLRVYGSSAVYKFERELKNETDFREACRFWDISKRLSGEALNQKLETLRATLTDIEGQVGDCIVELSNGGCFCREDVRLLMKTHDWLIERFSRQLNLLRNRHGLS
jgi:hypothetical protein